MVRTASYFVSASVSALVALVPLGSLNAAGTAEQQQACFGDAIMLCGSEIPDVCVPKIRFCNIGDEGHRELDVP
jgi:hypothetical protein